MKNTNYQVYVRSDTMLSNVSHVVFLILSPTVSTLCIILNVITIYVFCSKFSLNSFGVILTVNICACDIFVCIVSNTFYMYNLMDQNYAWRTGSLGCKLFKFLTMLVNVAQIYFLCVLTADRLRRLVSASQIQWRRRHARGATALAWAAALLLTLPRMFLFDEKVVRKMSPLINGSDIIVSINCKPVELTSRAHIAATVMLFVFGYALPACFICYAAVRTRVFMWKRSHQIHVITIKNRVTRMKNQLSRTFNLTAVFFLLVWTPFFMLSVIDLSLGLVGRKELVHVNFTLRCSLLVLGSAKPLIYILCLDKFRSCFKIGGEAPPPTVFDTTSTQHPGGREPGRSTKETPLGTSREVEVMHTRF